MEKAWESLTKEELFALFNTLKAENQNLRKELQDSQYILKSIGSIGQFYWCIRDRASGNQSYSENWKAFLGKALDSFFGLLQYVHQEDRETLKAYINNFTDNQEMASKSFQFVAPDGTARYMVLSMKRTETRMLMFLQDISELHHYRDGHEQADNIYQQVVNVQDELICRFKPDTTLTFMNKAYANFLQKSVEDLIGKKFLSFIPEDLHERALEQHHKALQGIQDHGLNIQRLEMHGKVYWHRWKDYPIYDEAGKLVEIQSVGIDITDKLLMQRQLEASERRYRLLAESSKDIIFSFDKNLSLTYVNAATEEIWF